MMVVTLAWRTQRELASFWAELPWPADFTEVRNAGLESEWLEPVRVGDELRVRHRIGDISARDGRSGPALCLTRETLCTNQRGDAVLRSRESIVRLRSSSGAGPDEARSTLERYEAVTTDESSNSRALPSRTFGPLTIVDTVRWAGFQENSERIHWDRDFARACGNRSFIASGEYRQALLVRHVLEWIGPGSTLLRMSVRHTSPTHEGDTMTFSGTVIEESITEDGRSIDCHLQGTNQDDRPILQAECKIHAAADAARGADGQE
jgi:acyl dehydratase